MVCAQHDTRVFPTSQKRQRVHGLVLVAHSDLDREAGVAPRVLELGLAALRLSQAEPKLQFVDFSGARAVPPSRLVLRPVEALTNWRKTVCGPPDQLMPGGRLLHPDFPF